MSEHVYLHGSPESGHHSDEESGGQYGSGHESVREQDRLLPIANVSRIMKKALPANAKISKEAKETVQECVSEFISFITGEASDKCQREKRKTVNGDDLLWAMGTLGFEDYLEPLKLYLHKYRELEGEKASMAKQGEMGMGKDMASAGVMGSLNGLINANSIQGAMQMMQQPAAAAHPYIFSQHHFTQPPAYHQIQPIPGTIAGNVRPHAGGGGCGGGQIHGI